MIVIDTEGLNSVCNDILIIFSEWDATIDMKIFSLSVLLCSTFVYNQLGHIDERAIENLSLVVKLSENISIS